MCPLSPHNSWEVGGRSCGLGGWRTEEAIQHPPPYSPVPLTRSYQIVVCTQDKSAFVPLIEWDGLFFQKSSEQNLNHRHCKTHHNIQFNRQLASADT
jgi:hypothetical protein